MYWFSLLSTHSCKLQIIMYWLGQCSFLASFIKLNLSNLDIKFSFLHNLRPQIVNMKSWFVNIDRIKSDLAALGLHGLSTEALQRWDGIGWSEPTEHRLYICPTTSQHTLTLTIWAVSDFHILDLSTPCNRVFGASVVILMSSCYRFQKPERPGSRMLSKPIFPTLNEWKFFMLRRRNLSVLIVHKGFI